MVFMELRLHGTRERLLLDRLGHPHLQYTQEPVSFHSKVPCRRLMNIHSKGPGSMSSKVAESTESTGNLLVAGFEHIFSRVGPFNGRMAELSGS